VAIKAGLSPFAASSFEVSSNPFQAFKLPTNKSYSMPKLDAVIKGTLGQPTVADSLAQSRGPSSALAQAYENAEGQIFVNGLMFDADDHGKMLESEQYLNAPEVNTPPPGQGWQTLDRSAYQAEIDSIKDPSLGTLAKKNFGIGVDNLQLLGGYGLELMGATETGRSVQEQQIEDLAKNDPYQREFSEDVKSVETGIDWFVANLAQQGPNMIESLATFVLGYVGGGGQFTGLGSGITAVAGKASFKKALKKAIKNRMKAKEKGEGFKSLSAADQKILRQTSGISAVLANNYAIGASDIFGEVKDTDPNNARLKAFFGAIPYTLLETAPEALLASRLLGGIKRGKGGIARRFGTGAGVGAVAEGSTEAGQEALLMGLNPEASIDTPEGKKRLLNAFAAGAGVGSPIGGLANLSGRKPSKVDLSGNEEVDLVAEKTKFLDEPVGGEQVDLDGTDVPQPTTDIDARAELEAMIATNNELLKTVTNNAERDELIGKNEALQEEINAIDSAAIMQADEVANAEQDNAFPDVWQQQAAEDPRSDSTAPVFDVVGEGQAELFPDAEVQPTVEQGLGATDEALQTQQRQGLKGINQRDREVEVRENPLVTPEYTAEQLEQAEIQRRREIAQRQEQNELQRQRIVLRNAEIQRREEEARQAQSDEARRERANAMLEIIRQRAETQRAEAQQAAERSTEVAAMTKKERAAADKAARKANEERSQQEYNKGIPEQEEIVEAVESSEETKTEAEKAWIELRPKNAENLDYADIPDDMRKHWEAMVDRGQVNKTNAKLLAKMAKAANAGKKVNELAKKTVKKVKKAVDENKIAAVGAVSGGKPKVKKQKPRDEDEEEVVAPKKVELKKKPAKKVELKKSKSKDKPKPKVVAPKKKPAEKKVVDTRTARQKSVDTANKADPIKKKQKLKSKQAIGAMYARVRPEGSEVRYSNLDDATRKEFNQAYLDGKLTEELINDIDKRGTKAIESAKAMAAAEAKDKANSEAVKKAEQDAVKEAARLKDEVERVWLSQQTPYLEFIDVSFADFTKTGRQKFENKIKTGEVTREGQKEKAVDDLLLNQGKLPRAITKAMRSVNSPLFKDAMRDVAYLTYIKNAGKKNDILKGPEFIDYMLNNLKVAQVERDIVADALREVMMDNPIEGTPVAEHPIAKVVPLTAKQTSEVEKTWGMDKPKQARAKVEEVEVTTPETLTNRLDRLKLSGANRRNDASVTEIEGLYNQLTAKELRNTKWRDHNIKDWFADGKLKLNQRSFTNAEGQTTQRFAPTTAEVGIKKDETTYADKLKAVAAKPNKTAQMAERKKQGLTQSLADILEEAAQIAEQEDIAKAATESRTRQADEFGLLDQWGTNEDDDVMFFGEDGNPLYANVGVGQVEVIAINFINSLKTTLKPAIKVYHDTAAFKKQNKTLFDKAKATGKFDESTNVMAFHMGTDVVLFSGNIKTEKQVKTILAHEILGHHGLRTVVPKAKLKKLLDSIYNADANIRNIVDHQVDIHDADKYVAIEEAIADKAMILDTSLLNRVWTMIKNALNKVGLKFGDEMSRYWVGNIRRFIRYGKGIGTFDVNDISQALLDMRERGNSIRFTAQANNANLGSDFIAMNAQNKIDTITGGLGGIKDYIQSNGVQTMLRKAGGVQSAVGSVFEALQTLNHKATRSEGLTDLYGFFVAVSNASKDYLNHYQLKTKTQYGANTWLKPYATADDKLKAGEILAYTAIYKKNQLSETDLNKIPDLVITDEEGNVTVNEDAFKRASEFGAISLADLRKGIKVGEDGSIWGTKATAPWLHDESFTEDHVIWKMYQENRSATDQATVDVLVADVRSAFTERVAYIDDLRKQRGGAGVHIDSTDIEFIHKVMNEYYDIRVEGSILDDEDTYRLSDESKDKAEEFLYAIQRSLYEPKKFNDLKQSVEHGTGEHGKLFKGRTDILERVQALRDKKLSKAQAEEIQHTIQTLFTVSNQIANAQIGAKSTIMGSYVQLVRDAKYQVRVQAYLYDKGKRGAPIALDEGLQAQMPYYQVDSTQQAAEIVDYLDSTLGKHKGIKVKDRDGHERYVEFVAERGTAAKQAPTAGSASYRDIAGLLLRLDINLTPRQQERVVTATSRYESQARKHLMRTGNPGWDKNVLKHIASYLETRAHVAAKSEYRYAIDRLMANDSKWRGDKPTLKRLAKEVSEAKNEEAKFIAKQRFDTYAYMYRHSAPITGSGIETIVVDGENIELKLEGRGQVYRDEGLKLLAWYDQTRNIVTSTEDLLSGKVGSQLKLATVIMQLGMSFATAAVNLTSIPLLTIPNLATYNDKRGFGGGFGFSKAAKATGVAIANVKNPKFGETEFLYDMVKDWEKTNGDNKYNEYGLTKDEAEFMLYETERGTMAPAQMNALLGSSRGGVQSAKAIKAITAWMYMFSQTEQLNRRVSGLAAYRLERDRYTAANPNATKQEIDAYAKDKAGQFVYDSQGNYDMYNRPEIARGNLFQYPMMYKQFTLSAIKLFAQMDKKGKIYSMGLLFLVAGLKGMPFADDIMDLLDTLAQSFGIKMPTVEKAALEIVEDIAPGFGPLFMRGVVDRSFGGTVSTRLGFGDLFPLTGLFKAGSDPWRETENAFGPVWTTASGIVGTAGQLSKYGLEALGLRSGHTDMKTILRESPITAVRAITDGYTFHNDGMITNAQGKVVSRDVTAWTAFTRMLGFYPAVATAENDIVRMSKQSADYAKDIRAEFRNAYIKAKIVGDMDTMNQIVQNVREWNEAAQGSEFYIRSFRKSANRAYREWNKTTSERYLKSAPKSIRQETNWLMDVFAND